MGVFKGYQPNIFRAVSGSLFSTATNWSRGYVPTGSDVATIADNCVINITRTIGSLVVRAPFTASISGAITLQVNDVINVLGHLSCSGAPTITALGNKNNIISLSPGSSSFFYSGSTNQSIPGLTYYNLIVSGTGKKTLSSTLIISNNLSLTNLSSTQLFFDLNKYDVTVYNTSSIGSNEFATIARSNYGNSYFYGPTIFAGIGGKTNYYVIDFPASPLAEFRNGAIFANFSNSSNLLNTGTGVFSFTTNNQTLTIPANIANNIVIDADISIASGITLTTVGSGAALHGFRGKINGASSTSKWVNTGQFALASIKAVNSMTTGSFDFTSSANLLGFVGDYTATIPSYFNDFSALVIGGTGTKTISSNTNISRSLTVGNASGFSTTGGTLELDSYNLTVSGSTSTNVGILKKSKSGSLLFIGRYTIGGGGQPSTDFSGGNPTVELRGGFGEAGSNPSPFCISSGTGSWSFTTNNQNITWYNINYPFYFDAPITISGSIALAIDSSTSIILSRSIDGTSGSSKLINSGAISFGTAASLSGSMTTGSADFSYIGNTIGIGGNYSGTTPSRFNTFYNLSISGTGTKTLGTSSYISGGLTNNTNGTLELGNQDLFVSGTTSVGNGNTNIFRKSGSGSITFVGEVSRLGWNSGTGSFDLSVGNPNVECRGGLRTLGATTSTFNSGFGTWSFAVNNQRVYLDNSAVPSSLYFSGSVLIKDGINLSIGQNTNMGFVVMKDINGTTSAAKLTNSGSLVFASSSQSMTTGTLDLTFLGNSVGWTSNDNHPLYYSTYNTLYIGGFGTKYATSSLYMSSSLNLVTGSLDLGVYNMFVSGTSNLGRGTLIKTSSGDIIFNGQINTFLIAGQSTPTMNISASYIEVRNGIILDYSPNVLSTQTFYFTTNNQTVTGSNAATNPQLNNTNFVISGAINLTISPALSLTFTGYMDGTDPNSKLTIGRGPVPNSAGGGIVYYSSPIMPMATSGTMDASSSLNVFVYNGGAQDIKGGIYRNLTFQGGAKTLQGSVSVLNTLNTGSVTVNLNGFTLTNP